MPLLSRRRIQSAVAVSIARSEIETATYQNDDHNLYQKESHISYQKLTHIQFSNKGEYWSLPYESGVCIPLKQRFVIKTTHNAKYKTGGLAATALAIGKVFVFTIKDPQERSGLFAVARSPSGSITTKMVRFRHEVDTSGFSSQRKSVEKVADFRHPTTLPVAFPLCEYSAKPVGGILFTGGAFRFFASKICQKRFRTIFAANRPISLIPHNE